MPGSSGLTCDCEVGVVPAVPTVATVAALRPVIIKDRKDQQPRGRVDSDVEVIPLAPSRAAKATTIPATDALFATLDFV